jgi:hypothetical protein
MCTKKVTFIALSAIAVAIPLSAMAEPHWHDRDIRHFHEHDAHHWATGIVAFMMGGLRGGGW